MNHRSWTRTWKIANDLAAQMVRTAIECGYRHLDSASDYGNEADSGQGIAAAVRDGLVRREDLWVTSKLWNTNHRAENVRPALERTMKDLQVDYLDLYLIHFPIALKYVSPSTRYPAGWFHDPNAASPRMELDPFRSLRHGGDGGISSRGIGSPYWNQQLWRLLDSRPPFLCIDPTTCAASRIASVSGPAEIAGYCQQENIAFTAFSPLGAPSYVPLGMAKESDSVLDEPLVKSIAARVGKTPAQVVLAWGINRGTSVIPKTGRTERLTENLAAQTIQLTPADIAAISSLDRNHASMILACFANRRSTPFTLFTSKLRPACSAFCIRPIGTSDDHYTDTDAWRNVSRF